MPSADEIQGGLTGAWRMMLGRSDGLQLLDLSADGFWNSFFAMVVALPPLFAMWTSFAVEVSPATPEFGHRMSLLLRMALIDFAAWVVPLVLLAAVAARVGVRDRFVHYVVSTNWASGIIAWLLLPPVILRAFAPTATEFSALLSLVVFIASMVFVWRLTNVALGKGAAIATAIFSGMVAASLIVVYALEWLLAIPAAAPVG
ncbi:MAG: transporter [Rhizobiaceae bacterium]